MHPAGNRRDIFLHAGLSLIRLSADMIQMKIIFTVHRHISTARPVFKSGGRRACWNNGTVSSGDKKGPATIFRQINLRL